MSMSSPSLNMVFKAIVAMDEERAIGKNGKLPWHIPADLKNFSLLTTGHAVLMGRKTYESLPDKYRPLPNRMNIVLSRDAAFSPGHEAVKVFSSIESLKAAISARELELPSEVMWIIGGAEIYKQALPLLDQLYLTRVKGTHGGDTFLDEFESSFKLQSVTPGDGYTFEIYEKI